LNKITEKNMEGYLGMDESVRRTEDVLRCLKMKRDTGQNLRLVTCAKIKLNHTQTQKAMTPQKQSKHWLM